MRFSSALIPFLSSLSWTSVTMAATEDPTRTTMTASNRDDEDFGKNNHASNCDDEVFEYWRILVDTVGSMTTNTPAPSPSLTPTGTCDIDTCVNCTAIIGGAEVNCEDIVPEQKSACECPECVRNLVFVYTGKNCPVNQAGSGQCVDFGPNAFIAGYRITNANDDTEVLGTGTVQQGDEVTINAVGLTGCIPDMLAVTISVPTGGQTQSFIIDSTCDGGRGLILTESYGAFESIGYSFCIFPPPSPQPSPSPTPPPVPDPTSAPVIPAPTDTPSGTPTTKSQKKKSKKSKKGTKKQDKKKSKTGKASLLI